MYSWNTAIFFRTFLLYTSSLNTHIYRSMALYVVVNAVLSCKITTINGLKLIVDHGYDTSLQVSRQQDGDRDSIRSRSFIYPKLHGSLFHAHHMYFCCKSELLAILSFSPIDVFFDMHCSKKGLFSPQE